MDSNFCQKLHAVNIPKTVEFIDFADARAVYYYLLLKISFSYRGEVLLIRPASYSKAIKEIVMQVLLLLKNATWKVASAQKIRKISFQCLIENRKSEDIVLKTTDNYQRENICK